MGHKPLLDLGLEPTGQVFGLSMEVVALGQYGARAFLVPLAHGTKTPRVHAD